jgi:thiamine biosynthesis lipoprotein
VPELTFEGIGTHWSVQTPESLTVSVRADLADVVEDYDRTWSRFRTDSLVSQIAREAGTYVLPESAVGLESLYSSLYSCTDGRMTPLVGSALEHLGYDASFSLREKSGRTTPPRWEDVMSWSGSELTTTAPALLDVGAAGKGQLVDLVGGVLTAAGIEEFLIDASGDLLHRGPQPVQVALEHPYDTSLAIGTVALENGALCASAANRRVWGEGLHHVLDGLTGQPIHTVVASWVLAGSAMVADGLATALFLVDEDRLNNAFDFAYVRMFSDGRGQCSANYRGELFS